MPAPRGGSEGGRGTRNVAAREGATPLETAAKAWRENMSEVKAVQVEQVAREYLADRKGKVGPRTHHEEELRLNRICRALQTDMSGLSKSELELFFSEEMGDLRGKTSDKNARKQRIGETKYENSDE